MQPTKDQQRASYAYKQVGELRKGTKKDRDDYKIAVKALGANILRSGLSAALADLMRRKASTVLNDLAGAKIPGLVAPPGSDAGSTALFQQVNKLSAGEYMLATRETLQVVMWLKRACDALLNFEDAATVAAGLNGDGHAH